MKHRYPPKDLTVAIVSFQAKSTILRCLDALSFQTVSGFFILVVDSSSDGTGTLIRNHHPEVRIIEHPGRLFPGAARNLACRNVATPLIAFVDSDCLADPNWVERILAAHQADDWIIGGSVGVANPEFIPGWASFLNEFSLWLRTGPPRHLADIPTCCISFKREAIDQFGPFLESRYCEDTDLNWRAAIAGRPPLFQPDIHVRHVNPRGFFSLLHKQLEHGRDFAKLRVRLRNWSALQILVRLLSAPLLPIYLASRSLVRVMRIPEYRLPALRALPRLLLYASAWSCGEMIGYWRSLNTSSHPDLETTLR